MAVHKLLLLLIKWKTIVMFTYIHVHEIVILLVQLCILLEGLHCACVCVRM